MKRILAFVIILTPQPGFPAVRVATLADAKAGGLRVLPVHLGGQEGGIRFDGRLVPAADALFGRGGSKLPVSATFSSSNGPAFNLGPAPGDSKQDLHARIYSGDSSRYGEREGQAKGAWAPPKGIDLARALQERDALKRWGARDPGLVVPVAETGFTAGPESPDALPYLVFSVSKRGELVSGKYIVNELEKPGKHEALSELLDLLPALTGRMAKLGIFAPKLDPTAVVIDKAGRPEARLIKSRLDDRDPEIVRYLTEELGRPELVGEFLTGEDELRAFYAERLGLMRQQAQILQDRRQGRLSFKGARATTQGDIARLLLQAIQERGNVRWFYKPEGKGPKEEFVTFDPTGLKYADWLKGFVTLKAHFGALRRIDRVQWAELAK